MKIMILQCAQLYLNEHMDMQDSPSDLSITPTLIRETSLTYIEEGDLFASEMQTIVNAVNCRGVMGKGIALKFKQEYPDMFKDYRSLCDQKRVILGQPYLWKESDPWILNFPTKDDWKKKSKIKSIEDGLRYLAEHAQEWGITSLAIPALGCGEGGLNWEDVRPLIQRYLEPLHIPIEIYSPMITPQINYEHHHRLTGKRGRTSSDFFSSEERKSKSMTLSSSSFRIK